MSKPVLGGRGTAVSGFGAIVSVPPPLIFSWKLTNCAACWLHVPPPVSENGLASGVKKVPSSDTPDPPAMPKPLDEASAHSASPLNGPSVGAFQLGGELFTEVSPTAS